MSDANLLPARLKSILCDVLGKKEYDFQLTPNTAILGAIPEFDSMAVVAILTAIETEFDITIDDDEIDAAVFETFGTLTGFVTQKIAA